MRQSTVAGERSLAFAAEQADAPVSLAAIERLELPLKVKQCSTYRTTGNQEQQVFAFSAVIGDEFQLSFIVSSFFAKGAPAWTTTPLWRTEVVKDGCLPIFPTMKPQWPEEILPAWLGPYLHPNPLVAEIAMSIHWPQWEAWLLSVESAYQRTADAFTLDPDGDDFTRAWAEAQVLTLLTPTAVQQSVRASVEPGPVRPAFEALP